MPHSSTIALAIVVALASFADTVAANETVSVEEMAYRELKETILRSSELDIDQAALILTLGYADNAAARKVLVEIADFYLGSVATEAVVTAVSLHGQKIVEDIDQAMSRESMCGVTQQNRCLAKEDRAAYLTTLRDIAASGEQVEYVW